MPNPSHTTPAAPHEDAMLIARAQEDPRAFEDLYRKYARAVYRYFRYRVGDHDTAEDLSQVTFLRTFARLAQYEERGHSFLAYLLTVAHSVLVNYYRKQREVPLEEAFDITEDGEEKAERHVAAEGMWSAIGTLTCADADAFCFILKHRDGLPVKEIALMTGRSVNAAKLRLSRVRARLAAQPQFAALV